VAAVALINIGENNHLRNAAKSAQWRLSGLWHGVATWLAFSSGCNNMSLTMHHIINGWRKAAGSYNGSN